MVISPKDSRPGSISAPNSGIFDEIREKILKNLNGDTEPFTVIIEDPSGKKQDQQQQGN